MADADNGAKNFFSPRSYDKLKFVAQIVLPALATLWFSIGSIWNLQHTTEIVGTITAVDLFLGLILQLSSTAYYKSGANFDGELKTVSREDGSEAVVFDVQNDPETVIKTLGKHEFSFRVNRENTDS